MKKIIIFFVIIIAGAIGYFALIEESNAPYAPMLPKLSPEEKDRAANLELDTKIKVYIRTIQVELMDYKQKNSAYPELLPSPSSGLLSSFSSKELSELGKHVQYRSLQNGASYEITADFTTGKITYTPSSLAH